MPSPVASESRLGRNRALGSLLLLHDPLPTPGCTLMGRPTVRVSELNPAAKHSRSAGKRDTNLPSRPPSAHLCHVPACEQRQARRWLPPSLLH